MDIGNKKTLPNLSEEFLKNSCCNSCVVKTSCTDPCDSFIKAVRQMESWFEIPQSQLTKVPQYSTTYYDDDITIKKDQGIVEYAIMVVITEIRRAEFLKAEIDGGTPPDEAKKFANSIKYEAWIFQANYKTNHSRVILVATLDSNLKILYSQMVDNDPWNTIYPGSNGQVILNMLRKLYNF